MRIVINNDYWVTIVFFYYALNKEETYPGVNLFHYIESNLDRINYTEYKEKGYIIGSGMIEGGNRVVLQKRLKQSGMRWNSENAQCLLSLRNKEASRRWIEEVEELINEKFKIDSKILKIPRI